MDALRIKKFIMVFLWIISVYWCKDIFAAYVYEAESMQFQFEQTVSFPDITVCNSGFMDVLEQQVHPQYDAIFPFLGHDCPQKYNGMNSGLQSRAKRATLSLGDVQGKGYDEFNFKEIMQGCLSNNPSTSILADMAGFDYSANALFKNITLLSNWGKILVLDLELVEKVFHEKYGMCYTLPGKYWHR